MPLLLGQIALLMYLLAQFATMSSPHNREPLFTQSSVNAGICLHYLFILFQWRGWQDALDLRLSRWCLRLPSDVSLTTEVSKTCTAYLSVNMCQSSGVICFSEALHPVSELTSCSTFMRADKTFWLLGSISHYDLLNFVLAGSLMPQTLTQVSS